MITCTRDKAALARFFARDPALYAYQLGDLDPFLFDNTTWWGISRGEGENSLEFSAIVLKYSAFEMPVILALTDNVEQGVLWRSLLPKLPERAHIHYRASHQTVIEEKYDLASLGTHFKMRWRADRVHPGMRNLDSSDVETLDTGHEEDIRALHAESYPESYFDGRLLETGTCVGIWRSGKLVSFAACHVHSLEYGVAALGAITTHPDHRGRGLGAAVTLALVNKLNTEIACICLNVSAANSGAIRLYEKLGFVREREYEEAMIQARVR
ncbi:MAG: GNAT family N-acetyltransferase [Candidatus Zixiibacteriota bacterium]